ncbi:unnamed protein product (macronuclear) [Paramecium tetraurelia]|uniref:Protein arginine methyltransferase NDUFAF7 n=1 Tax=Paramecium tetraurelia TaxID=5888 RepID=A0BQV8_PARTE|nr:uncharacterized protein GSPATT00031154001 [Paramecium tetraurelia]CAK60925.1 unnamed protein product [Paramecium tetraurelia]|eukprot:XP_001428323.1 hypothetical protein (macronuclear) [Paramecium tetraurelia strain d4-2]
MKRMLVRDFIYDRLYHPVEGYFVKNIQLGALKKPIEFKQLLGYEDYTKKLAENYPENQWLTPSEVFRPYYGITLGNYINQQFRFTRKEKLRIVEIGAGYGAACEGVLYYMRNHQPQTFSNMEYHLVDISPEACAQAQIRLSQDFKQQIKKGNLRIFNQDFLNYKQHTQNNEMWFFVFLEVFDNLAHDKVIDGKQVYVENMQEFAETISDPLIKEVYAMYQQFKQQNKDQDENLEDRFLFNTLRKVISKYYGNQKSNSIFLPTGALQVLKHIKSNFQNPSLVIADFDLLKNNFTQESINAPIVSKKLAKPHERLDYESYLVERGVADIFFPTDFNFVQHMVKQILGMDSQIFKAYQFAEQFSQSSWTTTKSGYNPLKEDFGNTSFLVTDHS